jgi:tetratricopeptide (TPR) repeat protein
MERRETRNAGIKDFDKALSLAPETYLINLVRGRAHETKGDFARALSDYNVALEKDGRLVDALVGRAKVRHAQGDVSGGDSDFAEAIRLRKDYRWTYVHRGSVRRISRDTAGAEADYRVAIGLAPRDAAMHVLLGDLKVDTKAYDEAIEAYTEALRMDEQHWPALIHRATALEAKGLLREAVDDLETALKYAPPGWDGRDGAERMLDALKKKLGG